MEFIRNQPEKYLEHMVADNQILELQNHCEAMIVEKAWGSDLELSAIADAY